MPTPMTMPNAVKLAGRQLAFVRSPAGLFVILGASIFVAEVIVMLLLAALPTMPPMLTNFLDATILVVLTFPALLAFAFWPLLRQLRAREAAEAQLQEANRTLEQRVQERTSKLQTVNENLRTSEERWHALLHSAHDAIISTDSNGRIISWNNGAQTMFCYAAGEVMDQPLTALMPERYREAHQIGMRRYLATGEARVIGRTVELHGRRKDGSEFPLELSLSTWSTAKGRFFTGILRDITERQRVQQENERLIANLQQALADVKRLGGLLPICAGGKKIRDDTGYWHKVEAYIEEHSVAKFTHGLCPICIKKFYPDLTPEELDPKP